MSKKWAVVLLGLCWPILQTGCSQSYDRGCYEGCLEGTVCDEATLFCVPADAGSNTGSSEIDAGSVDAGSVDAGEDLSDPIDSGIPMVDAGMIVYDGGFCLPGEICRSAVGDCDESEVCDDLGLCPPDVLKPSGTECRPRGDTCDIAEVCDGHSDCPVDVLYGNEMPCRPQLGECDVEEHCDGHSLQCPPDRFKANGDVCKSASCENDVFSSAAFCSGTSGDCLSQMTTCSPYRCSGIVCATSCVSQNDCASNYFCGANNQCELKRQDGQPCSSAAQCITGTCTGSYYDADGDGFGGAYLVESFCGSAVPASRSLRNDDCCDGDSRAFPGASNFYSMPRSACGGFDFNCDGLDTQMFTTFDTCGETGSCSTQDVKCNGIPGWTEVIPPCGQSAPGFGGIFSAPCAGFIESCLNPCPGCTLCAIRGPAPQKTQICN